MINAIILAAGRGKRMGIYSANHPKCLTPVNKKPLIELLINNLKKCGIKKIILVTGYKNNLLANYGNQRIFNKEWMKTNMLYSLLCAKDFLTEDCIISYADILYKKEIINDLIKSKCNFSLAYDPNWYKMWSKRFKDPLSDAETFKIRKNGYIREIGNKTNNYNDIQGQYMGVFKLKGGIIFKYLRKLDKLNLYKSDMTTFINKLIKKNISIKGIPYKGKWTELDFATDLKFLKK